LSPIKKASSYTNNLSDIADLQALKEPQKTNNFHIASRHALLHCCTCWENGSFARKEKI